MKKILLVISAVMLFGLSSKATSRAAFIYNTDLTDANSFKTLLEANSFTVDLIPIANTVTTNYSAYDVIITSATASLTQAQMDTLNAKNKPIVAIGGGGYNSLGKLSLAIGKPNGMSGNENSMYVENSSLAIYNAPIKITVNSGDSIRLFSVAASASPVRVIYVPTPSASIEGLVRYRPNYYAVIRQHSKYTFWGFALSPASMTQAGKDLFINTVTNQITAGIATGISATTVVNEPSLSVNRQTAVLSVGGCTGNTVISVCDLSGKTVIRNQQQTQINLSGLNKGVYVVKITSSKGVVAKKFIY